VQLENEINELELNPNKEMTYRLEMEFEETYFTEAFNEPNDFLEGLVIMQYSNKTFLNFV
jgi:hypothetical protein